MLSGYSGASLLGSNSQAWTRSLKREMTRSAFSELSPSMISQPLSTASAPRLAAPRRKNRRDGSGSNLAASLIRSFGSTPGSGLRRRVTDFSPRLSAAGQHRAQALRHQNGERHMHDQERNDGRHGGEVHITRGIVAAEETGQMLQLHRLPDRHPRQHDDETGEQDAQIEKLLHCVVDREIVMREAAAQRGHEVADNIARTDREKLAAEAAGQDAERDIDHAVDRQQPHRREMPEQRAAKPFAERDMMGKFEAEQRCGVVDLPARADHRQHGERVDPVGDAHPARVKRRRGCGIGYRGIARCGFDGHGIGPYAWTSSKMLAHARVTFLSALLPSPGGGGSTPSACEASGWGENYAPFTPPRLASLADPPPPGEGKGR